MTNHLLTFELSNGKDQLFIHGDERGLQFLIGELNKLLSQTKEGHFNHEHLMTKEWGGCELSSDSQGGDVLNHVKIYCWKGNKFQI